jgi:hypothetical protein
LPADLRPPGWLGIAGAAGVVWLLPGGSGGDLALDAAQQLMVGVAERADALALKPGGDGGQVNVDAPNASVIATGTNSIALLAQSIGGGGGSGGGAANSVFLISVSHPSFSSGDCSCGAGASSICSSGWVASVSSGATARSPAFDL